MNSNWLSTERTSCCMDTDLVTDSSGMASYAVIFVLLSMFSSKTYASVTKYCTQQVKEEREKYKIQRISLKSKIRARCSESEELFSPISGKNCKDRYQLVYITERRKFLYTTYRTEKVCCPGQVESWCKKGESSPPMTKDTKPSDTLTIVAVVVPVAVVVVLAAIVIVIVYRWCKQRNQEHKKQNTSQDHKKHNAFNTGSKGSKDSKGKLSAAESMLAQDKIPIQVTDDIPTPLSSNIPLTNATCQPQLPHRPSGCYPFEDNQPTPFGDDLTNSSKESHRDGEKDSDYLMNEQEMQHLLPANSNDTHSTCPVIPSAPDLLTINT